MPATYDLDEESGELVYRKKWCDSSVTHRTPGGFWHSLPDNLKPLQFITWLYWFAEKATSLQKMRTESRLSQYVNGALVESLQKVMWWKLQKDSSDSKRGGPGKIVCMDCTYFTKKRRSRSGFEGRTSSGHVTCILGIVEIDMATRTETGRAKLVPVRGERKVDIQAEVLKSIHPGSLIFTDEHKSYQWLGKTGFVHRTVKHKDRQFSRVENIYGVDVNISTNAAEGLFGRCKAFARARGGKHLSRGSYGYILAEFVWRSSFLSSSSQWRDAPVWAVMELVQEYEEEKCRPVMAVQPHPLVVDDEFKTKMEEFKESCRAHVPDPPPQVAVVVPLPPPVPAAPPVLPAVRPPNRRGIKRRVDALPVLPTVPPRLRIPRPAPKAQSLPIGPPSGLTLFYNTTWTHSDPQFGQVVVDALGTVTFPDHVSGVFSAQLAVSDTGVVNLGSWTVAQSTAQAVSWVGPDNASATWSRQGLRDDRSASQRQGSREELPQPEVRAPLGEPQLPDVAASVRPWRLGQNLVCLYPKQGTGEPIRREVVVIGYWNGEEGPGVKVRENNNPKSFYMHKMTDIRCV